METDGLVAIICAAIALVMLIALTVFTLVKSWRQISREHAEREHSQRKAAHTYDNMSWFENDHALSEEQNDTKTGEQAHAVECGENANTHAQTEVAGADQELNHRCIVKVETCDTSFWDKSESNFFDSEADLGHKNVDSIVERCIVLWSVQVDFAGQRIAVLSCLRRLKQGKL